MITNSDKPNLRCVNIDWLEVYCLEDGMEYPCNADYYRNRGYFVVERDYGTRTYKEMFTIYDNDMQPWIEVRRNPASGNSKFSGLTNLSCHLRLSNRQCYLDDCVDRLRGFLLKHNYVFKRIYRIDVCYDFEYFDSGDLPSKFARRFLERKYRKINQSKIRVIGDDNWTDFDWESLSWGSPSSMVSTKMYNKSKEIATVSKEKTWIPWAWFQCGLIDDPVLHTKISDKGEAYSPEIWRVEFSLHSQADTWLVIEDISGKKTKKRKVKHTLSLFDSKERLWSRFEELAYHYFRFKYREYKQTSRTVSQFALEAVHTDIEKQLQRKDRCTDKILFKFDLNREFGRLQQLPTAMKPSQDEAILKRKLVIYKLSRNDPDLIKACDAILDAIEKNEIRRYTPHGYYSEIDAIRMAIATRTNLPFEKVMELSKQIQKDYQLKLIF